MELLKVFVGRAWAWLRLAGDRETRCQVVVLCMGPCSCATFGLRLLRLPTMVRISETLRPLRPQYLVAALALIASFALDGLATRARSVVLAAVPKWILPSVAEVGNPVTLAAVVAILLTAGV